MWHGPRLRLKPASVAAIAGCRADAIIHFFGIASDARFLCKSSSMNPLLIEFSQKLAPVLKARGFKKTGATWYRNLDRMIQVLNIQKSPYADNFYVNVGIYLKALGDELRPPEARCHFRFRAESVLGADERFELNRLLDFTQKAPTSDRYQDIQILLEKSALLWLDENSTEQALWKLLQTPDAHAFAVRKGARDFFSERYD
ncbi:DUF4304 domain-containing protein [Massilia glaciei]|uniref:DUF4304 domain-containing protein n=1 Tax=Massilia glaciei TaxID=1524097 RepID=A0A2U2HG63_9BURK|nr:DUF4304 domain-containing protein [Massilia glaciei]PWF43921.1 DUF4304 domain-containing protein [Massilia glaciei]